MYEKSFTWAADFESTVEIQYLAEGKVRVWAWAVECLEEPDRKYRGETIDEFFAFFKGKHATIYFHNLKFDGSFIIPWLFKNGYTFSFNKAKAKEFNVLVDSMNNWYSITIQPTTKRKITLWDNAKLFPIPLLYLHNVYHTPTKKIEEDSAFYDKARPIGYVPTEQDLLYFENDLQVPAETLNKHIEVYGLRFKKTQASQSFYNFEKSFKAWKLRFPALTNEEDARVRPAYWGGISYVSPKKAEKDYYNIGVMDINSSYPHKASEMKLPYGNAQLEYGGGVHPNMSKFWVAECLIEFELKENHLPCIPKKGITEGRPTADEKWVRKSDGMVKIILCSIDYELIHQSYHVTIHHWCWSKHWAQRRHKEIADFVYHNNYKKLEHGKKAEQAKKEGNTELEMEHLSMRNRAKIDNNGFYGKFGEMIIKTGKVPYADAEKGVIWKEDKEDEQTEYKRKYLPVAIAITAYGRKQLVEIANMLGEDFLYCDTDSVHYLLKGQYKIDRAIKHGTLEMDKHKLGAWDYEGTMKKGRYLRAKCYMEETENGDMLSTVAGFPADKGTGQFSKSRKILTWDNFRIGLTVGAEHSNKLATVPTKTGSKLMPVSYRINEKESLLN